MTGDEPRASAHVLVVCTANICRSPMAQLLLQDGLSRRLGVAGEGIAVASAGIRARTGLPMADHARSLLAARELAVEGFRSRPLTRELLGADLVLTATREHRSAALAADPAANRRTFTLREFSWLLAGQPVELTATDPAERLAALVQVASGRRGLRQPERPEDLDLSDPYGRRKGAFKKTLALLDDVLAVPLDLLAAPPVTRSG